MLQALLNSQLKSRLPNEETLAQLVNLLDFCDGFGVVLKIFNNLKPEVLNDACYAFVPVHHFLVVAFDLVRGPCIKQFRDVSEDLGPLARLWAFENVFKIFEVCDICVILTKVPTVELELTLLLEDFFQQSPRFDLFFPNVFSIGDACFVLFYFHIKFPPLFNDYIKGIQAHAYNTPNFSQDAFAKLYCLLKKSKDSTYGKKVSDVQNMRSKSKRLKEISKTKGKGSLIIFSLFFCVFQMILKSMHEEDYQQCLTCRKINIYF